MNNHEYNYNNDFYSTMKSLMTNKIFTSLKTAEIWNARSDDSFWLLEPSMELTDRIYHNKS